MAMNNNNFPRQIKLSVVQLGDISYYVRSRVEVNKIALDVGTHS